MMCCHALIAVLLVGFVAACGTSTDPMLTTDPAATSTSSTTPEVVAGEDTTPPVTVVDEDSDATGSSSWGPGKLGHEAAAGAHASRVPRRPRRRVRAGD